MYQYRWVGGRYQAEREWRDIGTGMRSFRNFNSLPYINVEALREAPYTFLESRFPQSQVSCRGLGTIRYTLAEIALEYQSIRDTV
jgi:hypothetical protein